MAKAVKHEQIVLLLQYNKRDIDNVTFFVAFFYICNEHITTNPPISGEPRDHYPEEDILTKCFKES